jgi:hypothetical protein
MFKKSISLLLIGALGCALIGARSVLAKSKAEKEAERTQKVKADIAKLGVGKDARIAIKLRDKTKLAGYISSVDADSLAISDLKTGSATTVAYSEITQAKGQNLSTGAKIAIGIAIGAGATLLIILLIVSSLD